MIERNQSASANQARSVVSLGKKFSKTAFPNPEREGCPDPSTLRAMASRDRRLNLKDLPLSHVVSCSPCFREYLQFRRRSVFLRGLQVTAASVVVLGVLFFAGRSVWNYTRGNGESSILQKPQPQRQPGEATDQRPPAPLALTINLASYSPTRGEAKDLTKINRIHLPPKRLRINFLLPVGMEPGEYTIRMVDSAGNIVRDTRAPARLKNGITSVEVDLDLTADSQLSYSLMIRPPGLTWRSFPILVE